MVPASEHRNFSWTCHICLRTRPNDKISVAKHRHIYPSGIEMSQHVRYCNDDPICEGLAQHHDLIGLALLHAREEITMLRMRRRRWWQRGD